MKMEHQIRTELAKLFPNVDPEEEFFHLWLGALTAHLSELSTKKPDTFTASTISLFTLLNTLYSTEIESSARTCLTEEILEFYACDEHRMELIKPLMNAQTRKALEEAQHTIQHWNQ